MMRDILGSVEKLYQSGLYSNVVEICNLTNCAKEISSDKIPPGQICQMQLLLADSYLELREWKLAESLYRMILQQRKQANKARQMTELSSVGNCELVSEVDIKYKLHQCCVAVGQSNQAISVLQSIPSANRTVKVNMSLGRLYHLAGMEKPAIAAYREVLRECPLAVEALRALLQLGVKPRELQELSLHLELDWLSGWVGAQAKLYSRDYPGAVQDLTHLELVLPGSGSLLVDTGLAHQWAGNTDQAIISLARAAALAPTNMRGMDSLSALYAETGKVRELESLATRLMGLSEEQPQSWVAMGYYCHLSKKSPRAVYFAHKACLLDPRNVEALLLKGRVLLDLKKLSDAINHFREAVQLARFRYEAHQGLVECYLGLNRQREAVTFATAACKDLSNSARALTLYATVLLKEPMSCARAKSLLEKAAVTGHLPAVYKLVEVLDREGNIAKAVEVLEKQLIDNSTATLHQKLADLLSRPGAGTEDRAVEHYSKALALDPKNEGALQGLEKMEANTEGGDGTYDLSEMEDKYEVGSVGRSSPAVPEMEDSETEAVWSDGDLNLVTGGGPGT